MKQNKKSLAAIVGASIVTSLSAGVVNAAENPFALKDLASGYTHVAEVVPYQGKPGEPAKPAEAAKPASEMKCGAEMMKKNPEMKCGASMMNMDAPAAAAPVDKAVEKKCAGMKMEKPATTEAPKAH
jgi:uncharacterized low-complexity protein